MPFSSPLVSSPTLSHPATSPSTSTGSTYASPHLTRSPTVPTSEGTVGLGVSGAGELEVQNEVQGKADVTSPLELTQFVDNLLNDLESRFDTLSSDVLSRLSSLSTRVDSLETSLADLMTGTVGGPLPPPPNGIEAGLTSPKVGSA